MSSPPDDAPAEEEGTGGRGAVAEDNNNSGRTHHHHHTSSSSMWRWHRRRHRRRWVAGFGGAVVVTAAALEGLAVNTRGVARLMMMMDPTTTDAGNDKATTTTTPVETKVLDLSSSSFYDSSSEELLPWEPWELDAMRNGTCRAPPKNVVFPAKCCVGTSSKGGGPVQSPECLAKGTGPYDRVKAQAADFLRRHPVQAMAPSSRSGWFPTNLRAARSSPSSAADGCDTCRIIDHLIARNYALTFQGDSVMGQAFAGFECELLRRGYAVNATTTPHKNEFWKYGLRETHTLRVAARPRRLHGDKDNEDDGGDGGVDGDDDGPHPHRATVVFRAMYRPILDMEQVAMVLNETDIFVFDHGLHYPPHYEDVMEEFENSTTAMLATARNNPRTKLVVWKETTPQHFNASGGQWVGGANIVENDCVPITEGHEGVYRPIVERAAQKAGYARVVDATRLTKEGPLLRLESDLVVLPYRDFLVPLHDLHGGDCTHFCSSTYVYVPLWRSLRLALDAYLGS